LNFTIFIIIEKGQADVVELFITLDVGTFVPGNQGLEDVELQKEEDFM